MKTSTFIFIGILAVMGAYVLGRYFERIATIQGDVGDIKVRLVKLETYKMRHEAHWEWLHRIASHFPIVKNLIIHKS